MNKKSRKLWYAVAIGVLILFSLILLSSIIDLGMKLRQIHWGVEIAFYILITFIVFFVIINPIRIIVSSPSLSIVTTLDKNDRRVIAVYKKVAKNIIKNGDITDEQQNSLRQYSSNDELLLNLQNVFQTSIKKQLNSVIIKNARTVMISTAICQSARFDMITVFSVNLKMVKELVLKCGFRPSMKNLSKLTVKVFSTSLIAEGLENLNIEDIVPQNVLNAVSDIPFIKTLMASVTQGIANSLLTLRIGCVTRRYLFTDGKSITQEDIRRQSFREAAKLLPLALADTMSFFPKKVVRFFTKPKTEKSDVKSINKPEVLNA